MPKKPLSLRERGWGEGMAKAANSGKMGREIKFIPTFPAFAAFTVPSSSGPAKHAGRSITARASGS